MKIIYEPLEQAVNNMSSLSLISNETIGELAAKDLRKADVFKKFGIDFCCGGKKTLSQVCLEKGIDEVLLTSALNSETGSSTTINNYAQWQPAFLADYIYNQHHKYFYRENPVIKELLSKVAGHHGENYPFLYKIEEAYTSVEKELLTHFEKEEKVVFPFIKALSEANEKGNYEALESFPLDEAVHLMEADHEEAGVALLNIRRLSDDFSVPVDACNSFRLLYKKLEDLESDLHMHIHLENNILFPAALKLEKKYPSVN